MSEQINNQSPKKRKVVITVPDSYKKVSDEIWYELELYLYVGFLTASTNINGKTFVFKTINQHELKLIEYSNIFNSLENRNSFRARFIAYSIFMANGSNALFDRPHHIDKLFRLVLNLPDTVQNKIIENLSILNERTINLYPLVEVYAYENRSKIKWNYTKSSPIHSPMNTGIPGTEQIGMNTCQQIWTALSQIIERREAIELEWSHAKFMGSCFAGKGIRAIDERDKGRLNKERTDREELKMKVLYKYLNRTTGEKEPEELILLPGGKQAHVIKRFKAESAAELAKEMSAAASGEKDYHDMVIEAKQREMQQRSEIISRERNRIIYSAPRQPNAILGGSRIIGGKAEAEAYIRRMNETKEIQRQARAKFDSGELTEQETSDDE